MYACYVCNGKFDVFTRYKSHMRFHETFGQLSLPAKCMQPDCSSYFTKLCSLLRHIETFHPLVSGTGGCTDRVSCDSEGNANVGLHATSVCPPSSLAPSSLFASKCEEWSESLKQEAVSLVASLRANSNIPYYVIPEIMVSCQQMNDILLQDMRSRVLGAMSGAGTVEECRMKVENAFKETGGQLKFLSTRYKQDTFFEHHPLFVKPEECVFGCRYESTHRGHKVVYDTFEYVSIEGNLRALLQCEEFVKMLLQSMHTAENSSCMSEFYDGEIYRTKFNDTSRFTILLQMFYDGMGTTNPLRGYSASLCNMGVFYYVIKNLKTMHNSCHANVHLLSLCYSQDLKIYGYEPILNKFVAEINKLSCHGFNGDFPIIGNTQIHVKLCQVVCDNLALNGLFGFVECFVWDYFCTMCTATQESIQSCFSESMFAMRTHKSYSSDLAKIQSGSCPERTVHIHGVKRNCALNEIDGYHILDNYALDPMHILLEGVVPVELGCVLYMLVAVKKVVSLPQLNKRIVLFFNHNWVDKKNRPPELSTLEHLGHGLAPSMKAVQCWTLLRFLPIILGGDVDDDDEHWIFLLHLSHLVDLVFSVSFSKSMISYLEQVISDHLEMFSDLFDGAVRLRPKHHLLVHLPTVIRKSGPVTGMCCLKYELKNCFFKRSASTISNFTNVCKTLAYRHQYNALYAMLNGSHARNNVVPGKVISTVLSATPYCDVVVSVVGCESTAPVYVASKLSRATVGYSVGSAVVISEENDWPMFGKIVCFVAVHGQPWLIVVQKMHTRSFEGHFHAYCVDCTLHSVYTAVQFHELRDHHSLFLYKCSGTKGPMYLVRLPYHVF